MVRFFLMARGRSATWRNWKKKITAERSKSPGAVRGKEMEGPLLEKVDRC